MAAILLLVATAYAVGGYFNRTPAADTKARLSLGQHAVMQGNGKLAVDLLTPLDKAGNAEADYLLADVYSHGIGLPRDETKAIGYLTKAATGGLVKAQAKLGRLYAAGDQTVQNFAKAENWLSKAAKQGNADSERELGRLYDQGLGVQRDPVAAYAWYENAVPARRRPGDEAARPGRRQAGAGRPDQSRIPGQGPERHDRAGGVIAQSRVSGLVENHAAARFVIVGHGKSRLFGSVTARREGRRLDVSLRFDHQKTRPRPESAVDLVQEPDLIGSLVNHMDGGGEIDLPLQIVGPETVLAGQPAIDTVGQAGPGRPAPQPIEHGGLDVDGDHAPLRPDHAGKGQREETHGATGLQDGHAGTDEGSENLVGILGQFAQGIEEKIAHPTGTNMSCHRKLPISK